MNVNPDFFDPYFILEVDASADAAQIASAYRALARACHPDSATPDEVRMTWINRAYAILRDPSKRAAFDLSRVPARHKPAPPSYVAPPAPPPPTSDGGALHQRWARRYGDPLIVENGRYAGWNLVDLARQDPEYLRRLARHPSGRRYRVMIDKLLSPAA